MKYPYIGGLGNDCVTLFTDDCEGIAMKHPTIEIKGIVEQYWDEDEFTNITREYLANTYGEVVSTEHAEFIKLLAVTNGMGCGHKVVDDNCKYFYAFHGDLFFTSEVLSSTGRCKQITIPLPPKAEPEPKEWPQVGDKVVTSDGKGILRLPADKTGCYIVEVENNSLGYQQYTIDELSKPKTEAEILRDELGSILDSYILGDEPKTYYIEKIVKLF